MLFGLTMMDVPAEATFTCRTCGPLPRSSFHQSCLNAYIHRCIACSSSRNKAYFNAHKDTTLREWRLRKRVRGGLAIGRLALADLMERHGHRCFISEQPGRLTLIRAAPDLDFTPENAVPVLTAIAAKLQHLPPQALARWRLREGAPATPPAADATAASSRTLAASPDPGAGSTVPATCGFTALHPRFVRKGAGGIGMTKKACV